MTTDNMPDINDPNVKVIIAEIQRSRGDILSNAPPIIVDVKHENHTEVNSCFLSVNEKIKKEGGDRILGWMLGKEPFFMLMTADFHAVWKSPSGDLLDVTPKLIPADKIMFVLSPEAKYEDKQVNSVYINTSGNPLANDFIDCCNRIFDIENKGDRALQHGKIELCGEEKKQYHSLRETQMMLTMMVSMNIDSPNAPCSCRSGKEYKHCHGKILRRIVKS